MENGPFENLFPVKNEDFPLPAMLVYLEYVLEIEAGE